jgi:hypothetical protein
MTKDPTPMPADIAQEPYAGTSVTVAAAGASFISHWVLAAVGVGVGAVGSYLGYKQVNRLEEGLRNFHQRYSGAEHGVVMRLMATLANWTTRGSRFVVEETPGMKTLIKKMNVSEKRMEAVVFGSGLLGAFGFFIAPLAFAVRGGTQAHQGKLQFQRAQEEIRRLRQELKQHGGQSAVAAASPLEARHPDGATPAMHTSTIMPASMGDAEIPKVKITNTRALGGTIESPHIRAVGTQ